MDKLLQEKVIAPEETLEDQKTNGNKIIIAVIAALGVFLIILGIRMVVNSIREFREEEIINIVKSASMEGYEGVSYHDVIRYSDKLLDPDWYYLGEVPPWIKELLIADGTVSLSPDSEYVYACTADALELDSEIIPLLWFHLFEIDKNGNVIPIALIDSGAPDDEPHIVLIGDLLDEYYEAKFTICSK